MNVYDVFISYRRSDGEIIAKELYEYLVQKGLRVFLDKEKMEDGHYFTTQIEQNLRKAPNYILIATQDVFPFREGEDWVRTEIAIALEEYDQNQRERTFTVLVPTDTTFPKKETLPESVQALLNVQQTIMKDVEKGDRCERWKDKVLASVTAVNRCNLWHGAHRWWENSQKDRGRFANLHVVESLLSQTSQLKPTELPVLVKESKESGQKMPLMEALGSNNGHGYLIGEGGIGKTTALMHIMNQAYCDKSYDTHCQIPLFIELSCAPDTDGMLYKDGYSSFIRRSVYRQLREDRSFKQVSARDVSKIDELFSMEEEIAVKPIDTVFAKETNDPEYLLLLDGLNEVSTVKLERKGKSIRQMIVGEIKALMESYPNVRVILTSRSDADNIYDQKMVRYYLSGLEQDAVIQYLAQQGLEQSDIAVVQQNQSLLDILKIPLFLTMYTALKDKMQVSTRGEILKMFFSDRRESEYLYTESNRWNRVAKDVDAAASATQKKRITAETLNFILDFVLPEIAWYMEKEEQFYLPVYELDQIILSLLNNRNEFSCCGKFSAVAFPQYSRFSAKQTVSTVAQNILDQFADDGVTAELLDFCSLGFGILQCSNGQYGFIHQHIRDYFAAVKYINTMQLAVAMQKFQKEAAQVCLDRVLDEKPISMVIRQFVGEMLGEHYNQPKLIRGKYIYGVPDSSQDRNLIDRTLEIYRGRFYSGNDTPAQKGYGVYNLIQILSEVRGVLAGTDLSELDLTRCRLNGVRLSVKGLTVNLRGSKLVGDSLFLSGHSNQISAIALHPDETTILTASFDKTVKLWDAESGGLLKNLELDYRVLFAGFIESGKKILVLSEKTGSASSAIDVCVTILNTESWEPIAEKTFTTATNYASLSPKGSYLLLHSKYQCAVICTHTLEMVFHRNYQPLHTVLSLAEFLDDDCCVLVSGNRWGTSQVESVDIPSGKTLKCKEYPWTIQSMTFHPQREEAAVIVTSKKLQHQCMIINPDDASVIAKLDLPEEKHYIKNIQYSSDGKWLCISDWNLLFYNTRDYKLIHTLSECRAPITFNRSCSRMICSGSVHNRVQLYNTDGFVCRMVIDGSWLVNPRAAIAPSEERVATYTTDGVLRLWDCDARLLADATLPNAYFLDVAFSAQADQVFMSGSIYHGTYDTEKLQFVEQVSENRHYHANGNYYYHWAQDSTLIYTAEGKLILTAEHAEEVRFCGDYVLIWNEMPLWRIYKLEDGSLCWSEGDDCVAVDVWEDTVAALFQNGELRIYPLNHSLAQYGSHVCIEGKKAGGVLTFSADGKYLVQVGKDCILVRETENYTVLHQKQLNDLRYAGITDHLLAVSYSNPDDKNQRKLAVFWLETMVKCYEDTSLYTGWKDKILDMEHNTIILDTADDSVMAMLRVSENGIVSTHQLVTAPGLEVAKLDLQNLHKDSYITAQQAAVLRQYGAII